MSRSQSDQEPVPLDDDRDPLDVLTEQFALRCRQGDAPPIDEFAALHPAYGDDLRQLLPAVAFLENGKRFYSSSTGNHPPSPASIIPPSLERVGNNRIIREIGRGGMGIVYEAIQEPLGRRVAVKLLPYYSPARETARRRFDREALIVAKLNHPNIVLIHDVGEHDGLPYFVMSLIDGVGLDQLDSRPDLAPPLNTPERARWVARLGRQAASALAYAHGLGILHRDIKPANLLLDSSETLWLADFGLAKLANDLSLTATGELSGTLRYLPPECLHHEADTRSDIYSLGLSLYELATGAPAFPEINRGKLLRQIEINQLEPPSKQVKHLPRDLETIILKAIARDPSARYAAAANLATDLELFLQDRPIAARRASVLERAGRSIRRNPLIAALVAISLVLALVAAYFVRLYLNAPPPSNDGQSSPAQAPAPPAIAQDVTPQPPPAPPALKPGGRGRNQEFRPGVGPPPFGRPFGDPFGVRGPAGGPRRGLGGPADRAPGSRAPRP